MNLPDFNIKAEKPLSKGCRERVLYRFAKVLAYVKALPYRRISDKQNLALVLTEACGTCSTKHAFLAQLALENDFSGLKLMLGIFRMHAENTPGIKNVLEKHKLDYIPEAHNYLIYKKLRIDITGLHPGGVSPFESLLYEKEIQPEQIGAHKTETHKRFLESWLQEKQSNLSLAEIWQIREACIEALATKSSANV